MNSNNLKKIIKYITEELSNWPKYSFKEGFIYKKTENSKAFDKKFNTLKEAEEWLDNEGLSGTITEDNVTANVSGYSTPNAFSKKTNDKTAEVLGYEIVKKEKKEGK